jgi:predicted aminopeptidase
MRCFKRFLLLFLLLSSMGCGDVLYLSRLGWHQSYITFHSVPVGELLRDEEAGPLTKEKLRFVQEVKRHGEEYFGLRKTKNYSTFFEVKGPVLHVITACEKDRLHPYSWDFPVVGKVTYKSFFTADEALKEKDLLDRRGYDTFLQQAAAYSTLGWLKDPIFSSILEWNEGALANLILHEMAHATVYFKDRTDFNEQLATFIGNRGAIDFLTERYGPESKKVREAIDHQEDDLLFSGWTDQACQQLSAYYGREISKEEKLKGREALFQSIQENFQKVKGEFKTEEYRNVDKMGLNNAVLLAYRRYFYRLEKFEALYEYFGRDLKRVVVLFKEIQESKEEPDIFLERWMRERGLTVSSYRQGSIPVHSALRNPHSEFRIAITVPSFQR